MLGIVASPRKGMNTDTLVTKVLEGAGSIGAETQKIYLNDLEMKPCQACDKSPSPDFCFYKDGMDVIYKALETVDVVVIGTPAYYHTISAQLKLVIDRSNCLSEMVVSQEGKTVFKSKLKKSKKGIFIWVADFSKNPEHALAIMKIWCKNLNIKLIETLNVTRSGRGEADRKQKELVQKAFALGISILS
ncbi:flavodoxin family protein [candidate division WOR-3 bacterium]|nr:flavodoxin family protein [candidate division WOR-3 bacterium]